MAVAVLGVAAAWPCLPALAQPDNAAQAGATAPAPAGTSAAAAAAEVTAITFKAAPVGAHMVAHGEWLPFDRKAFRPNDLWQHYMHGIVDFRAAPVPVESLFGPEQDAAAWLDETAVIDTRYKKSTMPAIRVAAGTELELSQPLPPRLDELAGEVIRVFVWARGEKVGRPHDCWGGAPVVEFRVRDAAGGEAKNGSPLLNTQGTFPWHCYYRDIRLPGRPAAAGSGAAPATAEVPATAGQDEATAASPAGIYVRLANPHGGTVWFSTFSWEVVREENSYSPDDMQDPVSGSLAGNPAYDELPWHFRGGKGHLWPWTFLRGARIGLVGQPYDLTTKAGFTQYYREMAKPDRNHMCQAVRFLADWYHYGSHFGLLPDFEPDWPAHVAATLVADQDPETGFWGFAGADLSMAVTYHLVDGLFGGRRILRADRDPLVTPWLALDGTKLPHAPRIIKTVAGMQSVQQPRGATRGVGSWSLSAFDFLPKENRERYTDCSLAATSNAISLLRLAASVAGRDYDTRIYDPVKSAVRDVLERCVTDDGLWKQNSADAEVTHGAFMPRILGDSSYLERRIDYRLAAPHVNAACGDDGVCSLAWTNPGDAYVSVRLYVAPFAMRVSALNESHLAAIIQRGGAQFTDMDPFVAVRRLREASEAKWGLRWDYRGDLTYAETKLAMLREPLLVTRDGAPVQIPAADLALRVLRPEPGDPAAAAATAAAEPLPAAVAATDVPEKPAAAAPPPAASGNPFEVVRLYVTATTWYGEESAPQLLNVSQPATAKAGPGENSEGAAAAQNPAVPAPVEQPAPAAPVP